MCISCQSNEISQSIDLFRFLLSEFTRGGSHKERVASISTEVIWNAICPLNYFSSCRKAPKGIWWDQVRFTWRLTSALASRNNSNRNELSTSSRWFLLLHFLLVVFSNTHSLAGFDPITLHDHWLVFSFDDLGDFGDRERKNVQQSKPRDFE